MQFAQDPSTLEFSLIKSCAGVAFQSLWLAGMRSFRLRPFHFFRSIDTIILISEEKHTLKFSIALLVTVLFCTLLGCRGRGNGSTGVLSAKGSAIPIELPEWEKLVREGATVNELGCACENIEDYWKLYRYAEFAQSTYKIHVSDHADINACVASKFQGDHCQYKF